MRFTISSITLGLVSSLLARDALAAPVIRRQAEDVVTDVITVDEDVVVIQEANGSFETLTPEIVGTTTVNGSPVLVTITPTATPTPATTSTPATTTTPAAAAVDAQEVTPSSSSAAAVANAAAPSGIVIGESGASGDIVVAPAGTQPSSSASAAAPVTPTTLATQVSSAGSMAPPATTAPVSSAAPVTSAAPAPSSSASSSSSSSGSSSSSSSGSKRGLAYNDASLLSAFTGGESSWCYDWSSSTAQIPSDLEFVPLLWGIGSLSTSSWVANANAALASGSTHLMSFNEPDYSGQSDLSVDEAVAGYMQYMQPFASKAKIGAPAVTNGVAAADGSPMGVAYMKQFLAGITAQGGTYDFCAVHWYGSAEDVSGFQSFLQQAASTCGKPIWLTEFQGSGSQAQQETFLQTVLPWMDSQSFMQRYAYFMVAEDNLISDVGQDALSALGQVYSTFTS